MREGKEGKTVHRQFARQKGKEVSRQGEMLDQNICIF